MTKEERMAAQAEENRKFFIENCIKSDTPRLETETYPDGVEVSADIPYIDDGNAEHLLDIYTPKDAPADEVYLLIHGGAFVYGSKELDKCFGMHLALRSGVAVANINYRLMPGTNLAGELQDIFAAISFLTSRGYTKFHTVGDSAGGYLCVFIAILMNNEQARKECGLGDVSCTAKCLSTGPICGAHFADPRKFAGYYFDREGKMPSYIYNMVEAIKLFGCPPIVLTTGDHDMMHWVNFFVYKKVRKLDGVHVEYYCAKTVEDRYMHHVYAIAHPEWPEAVKTIDLIIENSKR